MASNCETAALVLSSEEEAGVHLFEDTNCEGERIVLQAGRAHVAPFLSFVVPENYRVRLAKSRSGQVVEFDAALWGTSVTDVNEVVDVWQGPHGAQHESYDGVDHVEVKLLGERSHLLAGSCTGIHEPPVAGFEPFVDGSLNPRCDQFMDQYCQSSEQYNRDVCRRRILHSRQLDSATSETPVQDTTQLWVWALLVLFFVLFLGAIVLLSSPAAGSELEKSANITAP
jgi:hypothetical protein